MNSKFKDMNETYLRASSSKTICFMERVVWYDYIMDLLRRRIRYKTRSQARHIHSFLVPPSQPCPHSLSQTTTTTTTTRTPAQGRTDTPTPTTPPQPCSATLHSPTHPHIGSHCSTIRILPNNPPSSYTKSGFSIVDPVALSSQIVA